MDRLKIKPIIDSVCENQIFISKDIGKLDFSKDTKICKLKFTILCQNYYNKTHI